MFGMAGIVLLLFQTALIVKLLSMVVPSSLPLLLAICLIGSTPRTGSG